MAPVNYRNTCRSVKHKHKSLSITEKVELLKKLNSGVSVSSVCELQGVGSSTVYDSNKQKEKLLKFFANSESKKQICKRKTMTLDKSAELDQVMMRRFKLHESEGVEVSRNLVKEQARIFCEELVLEYQCNYSKGWLQRFKHRHGLTFSAVCGEKRSSDMEAAAKFVDEFTKLISN